MNSLFEVDSDLAAARREWKGESSRGSSCTDSIQWNPGIVLRGFRGYVNLNFFGVTEFFVFICVLCPLGGGIKRWCWLTSVCSVCRVHRKYEYSRTERPRKTKVGTQVANVTRDLDTTFKVRRSKVNLQGRGNIVADSRTSLIFINSLIFMAPTAFGIKARWAPQA